MELIRDRHLFEIEDFHITLQDKVVHMEHDEEGQIILSQLKTCWMECDPEVDVQHIEQW